MSRAKIKKNGVKLGPKATVWRALLGVAKKVYAAGSVVASVERELRKDITRGVPMEARRTIPDLSRCQHHLTPS